MSRDVICFGVYLHPADSNNRLEMNVFVSWNINIGLKWVPGFRVSAPLSEAEYRLYEYINSVSNIHST